MGGEGGGWEFWEFWGCLGFIGEMRYPEKTNVATHNTSYEEEESAEIISDTVSH